MADLNLKQNDTRPVLSVTLQQTVGGVTSAINLTNVTTVRLLLRQGGTVKIRAGTVTNAAAGICSFTLQAADTNTTGSWEAEIEITYTDGGIETVPNDGFLSVQIHDDIA